MSRSIFPTNHRLLSNLGAEIFTVVLIVGINLSFNRSVVANPSTYNITTLDPSGAPATSTGWPLTSKSGKSELALAAHLKKIGAKLYGGWFCSHCYVQHQLFGVEAFTENINYIECHEQGVNPQVELCKTEKIVGYPTWDIKGKKYPGITSPEKLAKLSGYKGPKKFRYSKLLTKEQSK
jgi:hypothetical protein